MEFNEINKKLEYAFDMSMIDKFDTCILWASLSASLLWNEDNNEFAYPLYGDLCFENKKIHQKGYYNDTNNSFHMITLYYSNNIWYLLDFSTKYLVSIGYVGSKKIGKIIPLKDTPVQIEVPELKGVNPNPDNMNKIDEIVKSIESIELENEFYKYSFVPKTIFVKYPEDTEEELNILENIVFDE